MKNFPLTAAIFEGSLVPTAMVLGWLLGTPPLQTFHVKTTAVLLGVVATVPLLAVFWLCFKCPWRPFQEIAEIVEKKLMPLFRRCRLGELAVIAALAGLGEEMLFRGVLQATVAQRIGGPSGVWVGLVLTAMLFGLLHTITPLYALLAGLIGLYLGGIWLASGNLLLPIIAHGLYDFLVLWYLRRK